mgnify:CR=1 FL=1
MTHEVGARPWQSPSQYTTVDEVIEYYMARMTSEDFMLQLVDVMEMGIPVTTLANTIQMSIVMEGVHTVDTGMLVLPVLMEMMKYLAEQTDTSYKMGDEPEQTDRPSDAVMASALNELKNQQEGSSEEEPMEEQEEEPMPEQSGLMARRA